MPDVLRENPHFKLLNAQRGYVRCTVRTGSGDPTTRVLLYVTSPGDPGSTEASLITEAAHPALQPA